MEAVYHSDIASQGVFLIFSQLPGEGLGVRGNPLEWISIRNRALDEGLEPRRIKFAGARPLTPGPSPALGRGELRSIEFLGR